MADKELGFGVDLHPGYQASFDFPLAKKEGVKFAYVKTSQGTHYVPHGFGKYFARAENSIEIPGFYHFLEGRAGSGSEQAEHFLSVIDKNGGHEGRGLAVDFEDYGNRDPSNAQLLNFDRVVARETGKRPLVYSTLHFLDRGRRLRRLRPVRRGRVVGRPRVVRRGAT